jgi:hypothetical protein
VSRRSLVIVTGGQTGVDRGALDAAMEAHEQCGGWCPDSRQSEDGVIPERYPVRELPGAGYAGRTRRNVSDSDATLVLDFSSGCRGTQLTVECARELGRPLLVLDATAMDPLAAAVRVGAFIEEHDIRVLNVAGPRASDIPRGHDYARALLARVLEG